MLLSMKMKTPCAPSRGVRECPFDEKLLVQMQNTTVAKQRCEPVRSCISICNVHGAVGPSRKHTFLSAEATHNTQTPRVCTHRAMETGKKTSQSLRLMGCGQSFYSQCPKHDIRKPVSCQPSACAVKTRHSTGGITMNPQCLRSTAAGCAR